MFEMAFFRDKLRRSSGRPADESMDLRQHRLNPSITMFKVASRLCKSGSTALAQQRQVKFDYFSLPGEIRNEIMRHVVVPGEVHIRTTKEHGVKAKIQRLCDAMLGFPRGHQKIPTLPSLPGFQMLATCKLVYGQYHEMFYSSNTFFLPPGPLDETLKHFSDNLQTEHVYMISRIGVTLGLQDLTPTVFKQVQDIMSHNLGLPTNQMGRAWGTAVEVHLSDMWKQKVNLLRGIRRLKMVKLATDDEALEIDGGDLMEAFWGIGSYGDDFDVCSKEVAALVRHAKRNVRREIKHRVDRDGWRALRAWVNGGGFQSRL